MERQGRAVAAAALTEAGWAGLDADAGADADARLAVFVFSWYGHSSEWPWCSSMEGSGNMWASVAGDGRLRVFSGPAPSTATLVHSTPVQGAVLAIMLWTQQQWFAHSAHTRQDGQRRACARVKGRLRLTIPPTGDVSAAQCDHAGGD